VCCNESCAGACRACVASKTGVATGTCAPIPEGSDPDDECGNAACSGAGTCFTKGLRDLLWNLPVAMSPRQENSQNRQQAP
jgi:hypothetical protein